MATTTKSIKSDLKNKFNSITLARGSVLFVLDEEMNYPKTVKALEKANLRLLTPQEALLTLMNNDTLWSAIKRVGKAQDDASYGLSLYVSGKVPI